MFTSIATDASTFSTPQPLGEPFDVDAAPKSGGDFLGDYQGLVAGETSFYAVFARAHDGDIHNPTDIYASVITP